MAVRIVRRTWRAFNEDKASRLAASIAYAAMLSLAPLCVVLIAIAGWVLGFGEGGHGHHTVEDALLAQVRHGAGPAAADTLRGLIGAAFNQPRRNLIAQVLGWITFVLGAGALFAAIQDALNTVWEADTRRGGWKVMLRDRVASLGMVAILGFVLLLSFGANAVLAAGVNRFGFHVPFGNGGALVSALGWCVSLAVLTIAFALLFKVVPDASIAWRDAWIGAAATAVLFVIGQTAIAAYLRFAGTASAYGAAGSLLVILVWIYYSALSLLLGAEFTKVRRADERGLRPGSRHAPGTARSRPSN